MCVFSFHLSLPARIPRRDVIPYRREALAEMADHLDRADEFAVDLEHHSYRSFQGFTCLMQAGSSVKSVRCTQFTIHTHTHARAPMLVRPFAHAYLCSCVHSPTRTYARVSIRPRVLMVAHPFAHAYLWSCVHSHRRTYGRASIHSRVFARAEAYT